MGVEYDIMGWNMFFHGNIHDVQLFKIMSTLD